MQFRLHFCFFLNIHKLWFVPATKPMISGNPPEEGRVTLSTTGETLFLQTPDRRHNEIGQLCSRPRTLLKHEPTCLAAAITLSKR